MNECSLYVRILLIYARFLKNLFTGRMNNQMLFFYLFFFLFWGIMYVSTNYCRKIANIQWAEFGYLSKGILSKFLKNSEISKEENQFEIKGYLFVVVFISPVGIFQMRLKFFENPDWNFVRKPFEFSYSCFKLCY